MPSTRPFVGLPVREPFRATCTARRLSAGFHPSVSDLDLLVVVDDRPPLIGDELQALGEAITGVPTIGRGVELSVVATSAARDPAPPWPFLLHVVTTPGHQQVIVGHSDRGDPDLLMHYVVVRSAGLVVRGRSPVELVGAVDETTVLRYLAEELRWAEAHAGEAYCVLNAARAWRFLRDGSIVSKLDGAPSGLEAGASVELISRAIDVQRGRVVDVAPGEDAVTFVRSVRTQLLAAARRHDGR